MGTTGNRAFWARARGGPVTMEDSAGHQALPTTQRAQAIRPKSAAPAVVYALRQRGGSSCAQRCVQVPAGVCASARRGACKCPQGFVQVRAAVGAAPAGVCAGARRGACKCPQGFVQVRAAVGAAHAGVCAGARSGGGSARRGLCKCAQRCGLSFRCSSASPYGCTRISACPRPAASFARSRRTLAKSASSSRRSLGCARARRGGFADSRSAPLQIGLWCARCARENGRSC